jgi:ribosome biogenesis GTPase A
MKGSVTMADMNIQWYPGHMTKTRRMMDENIKLVDIVIELLDARIPYSSKNPEIDNLARNKKRIVILNKVDLADEKKTQLWTEYFEGKGFKVVKVNSITGNGIKDISNVAAELMAEKLERLKKRGRIFTPTRAMIVGIPNVGKSTLINKLVGKTMAKTGDRPGVTRSKQWVKIRKDFELLDTPGILWPKFEDKAVGMRLAFTGAVNDNIIDLEELSVNLIEYLNKIYPSAVKERYGVDYTEDDSSFDILQKVGVARGFKAKGGVVDTKRAAIIMLDEFRAAKLGKMTLETPADIEN